MSVELVDELENTTALKSALKQNQAVKVLKGGDGKQGTFVVKELVYGYRLLFGENKQPTDASRRCDPPPPLFRPPSRVYSSPIAINGMQP
jgi:hypothetical protein